MQNALIIGPISVSVTDAGFTQPAHDGHAFADSFCEDPVHPGSTDRDTDGSHPAAWTFIWNDGLLSTALRDWMPADPASPEDASDAALPAVPTELAGTLVALKARTGSDPASADLEIAPSGHETGPDTDAPEVDVAIGPILLRAIPGAVPTCESPVAPDELFASLPSLDGRGHALLSSGAATPLSASLDGTDGLPSTLALAEIALVGEKAADGDKSLPVVADDRPRRDGQATGLATVEVSGRQSGAIALNQQPDPIAEDVGGQAAAPRGSRSRPDVALGRFPKETGTGPSIDARSASVEPTAYPRVSGSFWERVFHDATQGQAADGSQPSAVRSIGVGTKSGALLSDGTADPVPVAALALHPSDPDQPAGPVAPVLLAVARPPDRIGSIGPTPPDGLSPSHLVSRVVVEAWADPNSLPAVATDALPVSGLSAPSSGPGSQAATYGPPVSLPVPQVAAQVAAVLRRTAGGAAELSLAPTELGRVRLRIEPDARDPDRLLILINVERPETLDLFRRHVADLADAIRSAGYSGSSIDFGQQDQGNQREARGDDRPNLAPPESGEAERGQLPFRNATGETLDLRL